MTYSERDVTASDWVAEHQRAKDSGLTFFDFMSAMDLGDGRTGVATHIMTPDASQREMLTVELAPGESLPSLALVYRGAAWHEREAHDLLGVRLSSHPDLRPILAKEAVPPLRRDTALGPRTDRRWPGLYEPGAAEGETRRKRPKAVPGINQEWLAPTPAVEGGAS
ncbi:MAG: NADH-quinone oxidoreductase subunit C [Candidatus Nanopelagicales bacterium]